MQNRYDSSFDDFAVHGDTISASIDGFDVTARIEHDETYRIDDDDSHNVDQSVTGCNDEQQKKLLAARKAWLADDWFFCGIVLSISKNDVVLDAHANSLWGIECNYPNSDNSYLTTVANELLDEAVANGADKLAMLLLP